MPNWIRVFFGIAFLLTLIWGVLVMRKNERMEQQIRIEMKKSATQRSTEAWAKTYDYECMMHNREVAALKREIESLNQQVNALEKQIERWEQIGKAVKLGGLKK